MNSIISSVGIVILLPWTVFATCGVDNLERHLDRYSASAIQFCNDYLTESTLSVPSWVGTKLGSSLTSACSCFIATATVSPTTSPSQTQTSTTGTTSSGGPTTCPQPVTITQTVTLPAITITSISISTYASPLILTDTIPPTTITAIQSETITDVSTLPPSTTTIISTTTFDPLAACATPIPYASAELYGFTLEYPDLPAVLDCCINCAENTNCVAWLNFGSCIIATTTSSNCPSAPLALEYTPGGDGSEVLGFGPCGYGT